MRGLFGSDRPRVYTIPPGANFLARFATALVERSHLKSNPEALADALIYVPNRRSERALAFALHQASPHPACLLPDIRALGDLEDSAPPPSAEAALADLPPILSPSERLGALTRLVLAYYDTNGLHIPAVSALSAARELARLLDQAALSGDVDWSDLESHVPEAQLAAHWQQSVAFLKIITDMWPAHLEDATAMDPYARRFAAAEAMAQHWQAHPPAGPVIIAGSTGATPASRRLMQAALTLPQGLVVLPGLDREGSDVLWEDVAKTPSHPQYTLARTLRALDLSPQQVQTWPGAVPQASNEARARLIHESLAPAGRTADWTERLRASAPGGDVVAFVHSALDGLSLVEARDETEEALLVALLLRETLETPNETAALVTPDAGLARRVSAVLRHWQVEVAPSVGLPLAQSETGSLVLLIAEWLSDLSHPVKLLAVLQHKLSWVSEEDAQRLDYHLLRGPRLWQNWSELLDRAEALEASPSDRDAIKTLLFSLTTALDASEALPSEPTDLAVPGAQFLNQIARLVEELADEHVGWLGESGGQVSQLLRELSDLFGPLGDQPLHIWTELLQGELVQLTYQSGQTHARLAIWGPLEARLQSADRLILAGLNEGVWPSQPAADAFLPRLIRSRIGLADPDERIGLSAHDFAQMAAAPCVTLVCSQRREDKPAIASRWVWRLRTLVRGALGDATEAALAPDQQLTDWLKALKEVPPLPSGFEVAPKPKPPIDARPQGLSVTRIETLIRDPYAIYCEYVLGLRQLDPLNLPPDVRTRGIAIHTALERFELEALPETPEALLTLLESELRTAGETEAELIGLRSRRFQVCEAYLAWQAERKSAQTAPPLTEERGTIELNIAGRPFTLSGTADRIESLEAGQAAILDFKTGTPPTEKQVRSGLAPQMPLQGLIAQAGGYTKLGAKAVAALTYVHFGTWFKVEEIGQRGKASEEKDVAEIIAEAETGLIALLTQFADPGHPYLSAPRPERVAYEGAYSRLARRAEWAGQETYD